MTTPARQRAHKAWRDRQQQQGGCTVTLALGPVATSDLDRLRKDDESRPACIRRIIAEALQALR